MGSSGIYSNLQDLTRYILCYQNNESPFQAYFEQMKTPSQLTNGEVLSYGMGIQLERYKGIDLEFHGGGTEGYRSYILHAPKYHLSLLYQANGGGIKAYGLIYLLLDILLQEEITEEATAFNLKANKSIGGVYERGPGNYWHFKVENDSLFMTDAANSSMQYLPQIAQDTFQFLLPYSKISFHEEGLSLRFVDFTYDAKKVAPPMKQEELKHLTRFEGSFKNEAYDLYFDIVQEEGKLTLSTPQLNQVTLNPFSHKSFYLSKGGSGRIDFQLDKEGKITGLTFSQQNIEGLVFQKLEICKE